MKHTAGRPEKGDVRSGERADYEAARPSHGGRDATGTTTILVVDDNVALAENIAEILEESGYRTVIAQSAEAALEQMAQQDVTGLVTDYRLPGRNGAQLIAEIRRRGSVMPAVVVSAFADDETIAEARTAGALEVLAKPLEFERLIAAVALMSR